MLFGSRGFIGGALIRYLRENFSNQVYANSTHDPEWRHKIQEIHPTQIIYCAGTAENLHKAINSQERLLYEINVEKPKECFYEAMRADVKKFIFLSSLKVLGEASQLGAEFKAEDPYDPKNLYARTKMMAEESLKKMQNSSIGLSIVRCPVVYGPGVKLRMRDLLFWIAKKRWILVPAHSGLRNQIGLRNLLNFLGACLEEKHAGCVTYQVADNEKTSLRAFVEALVKALGGAAQVIPIPVAVYKILLILRFGGRQKQGVLEPFLADTSLAKRRLSWAPPYSLQEELQEMANWYRTSMVG